jgi:hypothetical protein
MVQTECELAEGLSGALDGERLVLRWRIEQLGLLGFDPVTAVVLANEGIDLNEARSLVAHGCPLETAARILL